MEFSLEEPGPDLALGSQVQIHAYSVEGSGRDGLGCGPKERRCFSTARRILITIWRIGGVSALRANDRVMAFGHRPRARRGRALFTLGAFRRRSRQSGRYPRRPVSVRGLRRGNAGGGRIPARRESSRPGSMQTRRSALAQAAGESGGEISRPSTPSRTSSAMPPRFDPMTGWGSEGFEDNKRPGFEPLRRDNENVVIPEPRHDFAGGQRAEECGRGDRFRPSPGAGLHNDHPRRPDLLQTGRGEGVFPDRPSTPGRRYQRL